jgi:hypothetical protein
MENRNSLWENSLFLWPFSIAMLNYQRVICGNNLSRTSWGSVEKKSRFVRGNTGSGQTSGSVRGILGNLHVVISTQKQRVISTQVIQLFSPRVAPHIVAQHLGVAAKMTMKSLENCALHRSKRLNNEFVPLKFLDTSIL